MSEEKVIHEVRITETEDGFRIELKGDKEQLRGMVDMLTGMGRGGRHHHHEHGHHKMKGWGKPWKRGPWWMRRFGGWGRGRPMTEPLPPNFEPGHPGQQAHFGPAHGPHFGHHTAPDGGMRGGPGYDLGPWFDEGDAPDKGVRRI